MTESLYGGEALSGLSLVELYDRLAPLPEPPPPSLWPQAAGWFWLGLALLAVLVWLTLRWSRARRKNAYRRAALAEIKAARAQPAVLAAILRRTALKAYPRDRVAGLHGEAWLAFLDRCYGGTGFSQGPGRIVATAPYLPSRPLPGLEPLARDWVRRHRWKGGAG